jgi:hypothetical protein
MNTDRIDFISSYCDRWCERCPFTERCSAYAVEIATAMCGDPEEGLELAVGRPRQVGNDPAEHPEWIEELANVGMSAEEEAEYNREDKARRARIDASRLTKMATAYTKISYRWIVHHRERLHASADPLVVEALGVVAHDSVLVRAKLFRAQSGRDRRVHGGDLDDHPVQNDWNGSAKVALISLERSETAWRAIVQATSDPVAVMLADAARDLHRLAQDEFPHAMAFVRPGFDEPWR